MFCFYTQQRLSFVFELWHAITNKRFQFLLVFFASDDSFYYQQFFVIDLIKLLEIYKYFIDLIENKNRKSSVSHLNLSVDEIHYSTISYTIPKFGESISLILVATYWSGFMNCFYLSRNERFLISRSRVIHQQTDGLSFRNFKYFLQSRHEHKTMILLDRVTDLLTFSFFF